MSRHLTPAEVCERLIGKPEVLGEIVGRESGEQLGAAQRTDDADDLEFCGTGRSHAEKIARGAGGVALKISEAEAVK